MNSSRTYFIIVRLNLEEYNTLITNKNKENKNISDYVRSVLF